MLDDNSGVVLLANEELVALSVRTTSDFSFKELQHYHQVVNW